MPRRIEQPAYSAVDKSSAEIKKLAAKLDKKIRAMIADGFDPERAVNLAWSRLNINTELTESISSSIVQAVTVGGLELSASVNASKTYFTEKLWPGADLNLSRRIWKTGQETKQQMIGVIKKQLSNNSSWTKTALEIDKAVGPNADLPKVITDLQKLGKKNLSPADAKAYKTALTKAQRHVDKLAQNGAPTQRLRKAYQSVIDATKSGNEKAIANSVTRSVNAKMRYNAERVSRTEIARAYGASRSQSFLDDEDVVGYQSVLSTRHSIDDICDCFAEADFYGMGEGVYPKENGPPYPYHPGCLCSLQPVYRGEAGPFDPSGGEKYLRQNPEMQKPLLGKAGVAEFKENPKSWVDNMRNYNGMEAKSKLISENIVK